MPKEIAVNVSADHLKSLATGARPLAAIAELVWNGLDADAKRVKVRFDRNALDTIERIRVVDDGSGIVYDDAEALFGKLGDSWKRSKNRTPQGRGLHGKSGKGRFRAFALGSRVTWVTSARRPTGKIATCQIRGDLASLKSFSVSDPDERNGSVRAGTEVVVENLHKEFGSLTTDDAPLAAVREFASYLAQNPDVIIDFDGNVLDPKAVQSREKLLTCDEVTLTTGKRYRPTVRVIEWKSEVERSLHLCDESGVSRHELKLGTAVRAPGFHFTAYLQSDAVRDLDSENKLLLEEEEPDVRALVDAARKSLKGYFRRREAEDLSKAVSRWKEEKIYPYEEKEDLTAVETAERQVFDILAVNVEEYLPDFEEARPESRRFTFKLLSQALRENPESVQQILGEVLGLKKEAQDELARLLKKTSLAEIIRASRIVADRLDFLIGLENLVCDKETKKALLERDQLHKILEKEAWIFDEQFVLSGSEERLEEVLQKHMGLLGIRADEVDQVDIGGGKSGRIDLMLSKVIQPRTEEYDYLVVELKRPSKKIDQEVLSQIESYAIAVANDDRFRGTKSRWSFVAVSQEMDPVAERKANQRERPKGLIFDDAELHVRVWAKTWREVLSDARARLRFFRDQLAYEATRESAREYLERVHAKFLPVVASDELDSAHEPPTPSSATS